MSKCGTFLYFGYGSNLLKERILVRNPSARFLTIGQLQDYRLEFDHYVPGNSWHGAPATITECPGEEVWGCVWELDNKDMPNLDNQEGVSRGTYRPITVSVESPGREKLSCRSYQLVNTGYPDPRPSPQYLSVIQRGAKQNGLPTHYQEKLALIQHNGYSGDLKVMDDINKMIEQFNNC